MYTRVVVSGNVHPSRYFPGRKHLAIWHLDIPYCIRCQRQIFDCFAGEQHCRGVMMGFAGRDFNIAGKSKYNTGSSGSYTGRGSDFADGGRVYEGSDNEASGKRQRQKDSGKKTAAKRQQQERKWENDTSKKTTVKRHKQKGQ